MQPDEFTSFWFAVVGTAGTCTVVVPEGTDLSMTNACLAYDAMNPPLGSAVLYARVNGGEEVALVPFLTGRFESTGLDLRFRQGDTIVFRNLGAGARIHVSGTYDGVRAPDVTNDST